jgi:hypothetical protein
MGVRGRKPRQGIRIKTKHIKAAGGGVRRESRVKVDEKEPRGAIHLGVRIGERQRLTEFFLDDLAVHRLPYNQEAQDLLNTLDAFKLDGERWSAWTIPKDKIPSLEGFETSFGLTPARADGQTVMWAVAYARETFAGEHVFIGYADVTRPPRRPRKGTTRARRRGR